MADHNRLLADENGSYDYDAEGHLTTRWLFGEQCVDASGTYTTSDGHSVYSPNATWEKGVYQITLQGFKLASSTTISDADVFVSIVSYDGGQITPLSAEFVWRVPVRYLNGNTYAIADNTVLLFALEDDIPLGQILVDVDLAGAGSLDVDAAFNVHKLSQIEHFQWDYRSRMTGMTRYAVTGYTDNTTTGMSLPVRVVGQMDTPIAAEVSVEKTVAYKYDVFDNLIEKTVDGAATGPVVTQYVNQGGHPVYEFTHHPDDPNSSDANESYTETIRRLFAPNSDQMLAIDYAKDAAINANDVSQFIWTLTDGQDSVTDIVVDTAGSAVFISIHIETDVFGVPSSAAAIPDYVETTLRAGRQYDTETGFYFDGDRWYDPAVNRAISESTAVLLTEDPNAFRYNSNNRFGGGSYLNAEQWASLNFASNLLAGISLGVTGSVIVAPLLPAAVANGVALANISAGAGFGMVQTAIANPDASMGSYLFAGALGGLGGYFAPYSIYGGIAGIAAGAGIGYGFGDWRVGAQIGGLAGQIIAGGVQFGWPAAAFEASGALAGAGIGYAYSHNIHDALFGANMGSMAGGIAHSGYSAYSRMRSARAAAVSAPSVAEETTWLSRLNKGRVFNQARAGVYPYDEVFIENAGGRFVVDSYSPGREIISRKFTQIAHTPNAAISYINEAARRYRPGSLIADVPSNVKSGLAGRTLTGQLILEIPVQKNPVPQCVLDAATRKRVVIRDAVGRTF